MAVGAILYLLKKIKHLNKFFGFIHANPFSFIAHFNHHKFVRMQ
jgi:hypothetical protein